MIGKVTGFIHSEQEVQVGKPWRIHHFVDPTFQVKVIRQEKMKPQIAFIASRVAGLAAAFFTLGIALASSKVRHLLSFSRVIEKRTYILLEPGILEKIMRGNISSWDGKKREKLEKEKFLLLQKAMDKGARFQEPDILTKIVAYGGKEYLFIFKKAIEQGAELWSLDQNGRHVFSYVGEAIRDDYLRGVVREGGCDYLRLLLDHPDFDIKKLDKKGNSFLHYFSTWYRIALSIVLKKYPDIDVNVVNSKGETPLHWAINNEDWEAVMLLIAKGANPNLPDKRGYTPMHYAALAKNRDIFIYLLKQGGTAKYPENEEGITPEQLLSYRPPEGNPPPANKIVKKETNKVGIGICNVV